MPTAHGGVGALGIVRFFAMSPESRTSKKDGLRPWRVFRNRIFNVPSLGDYGKLAASEK